MEKQEKQENVETIHSKVAHHVSEYSYVFWGWNKINQLYQRFKKSLPIIERTFNLTEQAIKNTTSPIIKKLEITHTFQVIDTFGENCLQTVDKKAAVLTEKVKEGQERNGIVGAALTGAHQLLEFSEEAVDHFLPSSHSPPSSPSSRDHDQAHQDEDEDSYEHPPEQTQQPHAVEEIPFIREENPPLSVMGVVDRAARDTFIVTKRVLNHVNEIPKVKEIEEKIHKTSFYQTIQHWVTRAKGTVETWEIRSEKQEGESGVWSSGKERTLIVTKNVLSLLPAESDHNEGSS